MRKEILFCLLFTTFGLMCFSLVGAVTQDVVSVSSEPDSSAVDSRDSSVFAFFSGIQAQRQEKVWLHLDKPYYAAGDTIWFRPYLISAMTHTPDTLSNFIHVELIDRRNKPILSKKIKRDSLGFANNFCLPDSLPANEYILQAYTGWMLNFSPEVLFQRNISIGKAASNIQTSITYIKTNRMIIRFSAKSGAPLTGNEASFALFDKNGQTLSAGEQPTSPTGALFVSLPADSVIKGGYVETRMKLKNGAVYKRIFFLEPRVASFDIQFLPEGGDLVPGKPQSVAFRAVRSDGFPADVNGMILNHAGDTVVQFSSTHDGMGLFSLIPQFAESYRAVSQCNDTTITTVLPAVQAAGCALKVNSSRETLRYQILGKVPAESMLIGHIRGVCHFALPVDRTEGIIKTDSLPEGVLHLLLIDSSGFPRTERLVYITNPTQRSHYTVTTDKPTYGKREKVTIDLDMQQDSLPLSGLFSVSITDAKVIKSDSLAENICSYLLLSSDLKGYVHNSGYYFLDESPERQHALDLVMMTHGWRRFKTDNLFHPKSFTPKHYFEYGQFISGRVITLGGRVAKKASVVTFALNQDNVIGNAVSDSAGRFLIEGLDFQDSTVFFLSSKNKRGRIPFEVKADKLYPQPKFNPLIPFLPDEQLKSQNQDLQRYADLFTQVNNKGLWEIDIEEVTVMAKNPDRSAIPLNTEVHEDTARFAEYANVSLEQYVKHLPNLIWVANDRVYIKPRSGKPIQAQLRVDNIILAGSAYLHRFTVGELKSIRFITPVGSTPSFMSNPKWGDYPCRIEVSLREDVNGTRNCAIYRVNGYAKHIEFYSPVYDTPDKLTDKKPDNRTTLYWNPYLHVEDGKALIEFYSNDTENPQYEITIEGITPQGIPCRYHQKL